MNNELLYDEILTSKKTLMLFLILTGAFFVLFLWQYLTRGYHFLSALLLFFFFFFLFYAINYRKLEIRITQAMLTLKFGLFTWRVPVENIAAYKLDKIPALAYLGGAGIHFMFVKGRYRASFNFLEYPRVVLTFKNKIAPIQDISFSTQEPESVIQKLDEAINL